MKPLKKHDNPETGQWGKTDSEDIIVNEKYGFPRIRNAQMPHLSRYACAWSN